MILIRRLIQITALVCLLPVLPVKAQVPAPKVPAFTFYQLNKKVFTDKQLLKGKLLFFIFFDVTCDHCQHALQQANLHYKDLNKTAVYLISMDNEKMIHAFLAANAPDLIKSGNVLLLQDVNYEFIKKFTPRKYPSIFLYSRDRKLLLYDDNENNMVQFFKLIVSN
jgi:hypothetical protein